MVAITLLLLLLLLLLFEVRNPKYNPRAKILYLNSILHRPFLQLFL